MDTTECQTGSCSSEDGKLLFINDRQVKSLLNWEDTLHVIEFALRMQYLGKSTQPPRLFVQPKSASPSLYVMPGYLQNAFACKLVTVSDNSNRNMSNILANIALFDDTTGELQAIMAGSEITKWRTAAASLLATQKLLPKCSKILAILGAGEQAEIHAIAFNLRFQFEQIRIWNRSHEKAVTLADKLNAEQNTKIFVASSSIRECVSDADVIITTTSSSDPLVDVKLVKEGAHINAVGVWNGQVRELSSDIYEIAHIYVDSKNSVGNEMRMVLPGAVNFQGEVGALLAGHLEVPEKRRVTVFQNVGMAVEDCAMARVIYDRFQSRSEFCVKDRFKYE